MKRLVILPEVLFTSHLNQVAVYASSTKKYNHLNKTLPHQIFGLKFNFY